jgi:predicted aspartyl protease
MRKLLAAAALFLAAISPAAGEDCRLVQVAMLDMGTDSSGSVYVPMIIGGQSVNMLIDTGGIFSMLTEDSVQRLGLKKLPAFDASVVMFGGKRITQYTEAHDVSLGGLKAASMPMQVLPTGALVGETGGIIAPNILRSYDDDFDFANAKFRLFSPDHCPGKVVYWTAGGYAEIPFTLDREGHIDLPVQIDGKSIRATLDTGAWRSAMSLQTARHMFHIDENDPKLTAAPGVSSWHGLHYPFEKLTLDDVAVEHPDLVLISDDASHFYGDSPKLLLGMGILRQLHLYIAYREKKLYVTAASAH